MRIPACLLLLVLGLPSGALAAEAEMLTLDSPGGRLSLRFGIEGGRALYALDRDGLPLIAPSRLGLQFRDGPPLDRGLALIASRRDRRDETWTLPWGECAEVRDRHEELRVELRGGGRRLDIVFRLFDDGLGFRYELPAQPELADFAVMDEVTEFILAGDARVWWIPAMEAERYEYLYRRTEIAGMRTAHTPLTIECAGGAVLCVHEAALTDFASMALEPAGERGLRCRLIPWSSGVAAVGRTPFVTPWRALLVADRAGELVESTLILNLNEPCRIADTSWIRPTKYAGIWWGMHLGLYSWGSGPRHGATTGNARRHVDFAAENGLGAVLIEGWNRGWDGDWWGKGSEFDFTTPHPDIDYESVCRYAAERGVSIIGHHETGADIDNYERRMEAAFAYCESLGIGAVKTGYVGRKCGGEWHHGQYMVRHYRRVVETAARHRVALDVHEPIKDTGIRRTWPNMMTREGARGQEYNAWSGDGGNPPEHETVLPFTRLLAGPFDFTPGIFDLLFPELRPNNRVNTTLAKQLALYVVLYSPLQMAADLPENYEGRPAFRFIREVPCDWAEIRGLDGRIGDFAVIARRDRRSDDWYLGCVTDEEGRDLSLRLDFLESGRRYRATLYADGPGAHWESDPYPLEIRELEVDADTVLPLRLAPGGGLAARFAAEQEIPGARAPGISR